MSDVMPRLEGYQSAMHAESNINVLHLPLPSPPPDNALSSVDAFSRSNVSDLGDKELMGYFGLFTHLHVYASYELAICEAQLECAEQEFKYSFSSKLLDCPKEYKNIKDREACVRSDDRIAALESNRLGWKTRVSLLDTLTSGYEAKSKLCSRELSRRTSDVNKFMMTNT